MFPAVVTQMVAAGEETGPISWERGSFFHRSADCPERKPESGNDWNIERRNQENGGPTAIIDSRIVRVGDEIGGYVVTEIRKDTVVLNNGTENLELKLEIEGQ